MYPGAQGNIRFGGKRFWTDCLYPYIQTDYGQAGWMKEEPPVIYAGECQKIPFPLKNRPRRHIPYWAQCCSRHEHE